MTDWLKVAKTLAVSRKTRQDCDCGKGKTRIINHNTSSYSYMCFRCEDSGFVSKGKQTLEELAHVRALNEAAANERYDIKLPNDFTTEIPLVGRLWLYKGGITESVWRQYKFGWSEKMQRVVMPVYKGEKLVWFQARAVLHGQKPKYLNPTGDRNALIFWADSTPSGSVRGTPITVNEDILSAIRVGAVTPACSLLGTKITTAQANQLAQYDRVTTWLDSDRAGVEGAHKIRRLLGMVTEVRNIVTTRDPKLQCNDTIRELLCTQ